MASEPDWCTTPDCISVAATVPSIFRSTVYAMTWTIRKHPLLVRFRHAGAALQIGQTEPLLSFATALVCACLRRVIQVVPPFAVFIAEGVRCVSCARGGGLLAKRCETLLGSGVVGGLLFWDGVFHDRSLLGLARRVGIVPSQTVVSTYFSGHW